MSGFATLDRKNHRLLEKYIEKYAEPEALASNALVVGSYDFVIVIPCYDEPIERVHSMLRHQFANDNSRDESNTVLYIVVVNAPESAVSQALSNTNALLMSFESSALFCFNSAVNGQRLYQVTNTDNAVLVVDRVSQKIPDKEGVGLARKIGADIAVKLFAQNKVRQPWGASTDADAQLPEKYLATLRKMNNQPYSGAVFPFEHKTADRSLELPSALYDASLRYYVNALRWAGSPFSYHTIGSCLSFNLLDYVKVRGFPKRAGGEDFYLLNKLCKLSMKIDRHGANFVVSGIHSHSEPPLVLQARESHRVPFGTGPALSRIKSSHNPLSDFSFYHPANFLLLKCWISSINSFWSIVNAQPQNSLATLWEFALRQQRNSLEDVNDKPSESDMSLMISYAEQSGWYGALAHCLKQHKKEAPFCMQLHTWFDGFRTLKFVHFMRDSYYSSLPASSIKEFADQLPDQFTKKVWLVSIGGIDLPN